MDLVDTLGDSHPCFEEEAGINNSPQDAENHDDENHPSRPTSRLGFNRPALSTGSPKRHETHTHKSEAIQWSRSLFQSVGISELRLSALKTHSGGAAGTDTSARSTSDIGESSIPALSGGKEYFESPYETASEDMVKYAKVDRKSASKSPPPVSRLSFPFVTTPPPRRNKSSPSLRPSQRHKYSCFPSLMSPATAAHRSPSHQRHSYRQHGYSRLALQHLKWFWAVREHERETCTSDLHTNSHDTLSPDSLVQPAVIHTSNCVPTSYAHSHQTLPPLTVYPRRGDITALRDPYSFHIDRCFAGLANWTIGKILWMLDVHAAVEKRKMEADIEAEGSDEESESELDMSASAGFSDDSDSTLVESENESDLLNLRNTILDSTMIDNNEVAAASPQVLSVGYLDDMNWSRSVYTHIPKSKNLDCKNLPWATNWYHRWALLVDISHGDKDRKHLPFGSAAPPIEFIPTIKDETGPHFILAGKHKNLANNELWLGN
ncbi:hypothetical protein BYT27DRAFT_7191149 [Phlegmacium glaucopus]|nr:hypothetical protein BYT27DRAFT_7191149 [Phlegmacium glaucopus]